MIGPNRQEFKGIWARRRCRRGASPAVVYRVNAWVTPTNRFVSETSWMPFTR